MLVKALRYALLLSFFSCCRAAQHTSIELCSETGSGHASGDETNSDNTKSKYVFRCSVNSKAIAQFLVAENKRDLWMEFTNCISVAYYVRGLTAGNPFSALSRENKYVAKFEIHGNLFGGVSNSVRGVSNGDIGTSIVELQVDGNPKLKYAEKDARRVVRRKNCIYAEFNATTRATDFKNNSQLFRVWPQNYYPLTKTDHRGICEKYDGHLCFLYMLPKSSHEIHYKIVRSSNTSSTPMFRKQFPARKSRSLPPCDFEADEPCCDPVQFTEAMKAYVINNDFCQLMVNMCPALWIHEVGDDCTCNISIYFPEKLPTLTIGNSNLLQLFPPNSPTSPTSYCVNSGNNLQELDVSSVSVPERTWANLPIFNGLIRLRKLNIQHTGHRELYIEQLRALPSLEELLVGYNDFQSFISSDSKAEIFHCCPRLISLNLAGCNLVDIPPAEFAPLVSLRFLNLSENHVNSLNLLLLNCKEIENIDLSYNQIEKFSPFMMNQLQRLGEHKYSLDKSRVEINLQGNPLSCLCAAQEFVGWIQSTESVMFTGLADYTCLYPDGTQRTLTEVSTTLLAIKCEMIDKVRNNSACPCDYSTLLRLYEIRYSLDDLYCVYPDGTLIEIITLDPNATASICEKTFPKIPVKVVAPSVILPIVALTAALTTFIIIYKRKRPLEFERALECIGMNQLTGAVTALMSGRHQAQPDVQLQYSAFIAYDLDDRRDIIDNFLPGLQSAEMRIMMEDELPVGSNKIDSLLAGIAQCRSVLLLLSQSFLSHEENKNMAMRAIATNRLVIPIVYRALGENDEQWLTANIPKKYRPLRWSETDPDVQREVLNEIKARLTGDDGLVEERIYLFDESDSVEVDYQPLVQGIDNEI